MKTLNEITEYHEKLHVEAEEIRAWYDEADAALQRVGKLLRTTDAGKAMWSAEHKTAISGLRVIVQKLQQDVPYRGL